MSETCDGCHADATHFLCDTCLDNEGVEKLRAEVERLREAQVALIEAETENTTLRERLASSEAEVERLRERLQFDPGGSDRIDALEDAVMLLRADADKEWGASATERARLEAEVERLREALEVLVAEIEAEHDEYEERHGERPQMRALQQARATLAGKAEP